MNKESLKRFNILTNMREELLKSYKKRLEQSYKPKIRTKSINLPSKHLKNHNNNNLERLEEIATNEEERCQRVKSFFHDLSKLKKIRNHVREVIKNRPKKLQISELREREMKSIFSNKRDLNSETSRKRYNRKTKSLAKLPKISKTDFITISKKKLKILSEDFESLKSFGSKNGISIKNSKKINENNKKRIFGNVFISQNCRDQILDRRKDLLEDSSLNTSRFANEDKIENSFISKVKKFKKNFMPRINSHKINKMKNGNGRGRSDKSPRSAKRGFNKFK